MTNQQRPRAWLDSITMREIWASMVSKTWGKWVLGATVILAIAGPFAAVRDFNAESAAVAMVTRADSGGSVLVPATCGVAGAELNRHYVVADGKSVRGRTVRSTCFYTVSAFKRFFPNRFKNDNPVTFRVQQLTTGTRLLVPSKAHAMKMLFGFILVPPMVLALGMARSATDLIRERAREDKARRVDAEV